MVNYIYKKVEKIVRKNKTRCPYEISNELGIIVMFRDLAELKGFYTVENKSRYIIINQNLDEHLQRVICCHELGHDCLHRQFVKHDLFRESTFFDHTGRIEREANIFAADLLITDSDILLKAKWENNTLEHIAKILCVPEALVRFKVYSIGKRGYDVREQEVGSGDFLRRY